MGSGCSLAVTRPVRRAEIFAGTNPRRPHDPQASIHDVPDTKKPEFQPRKDLDGDEERDQRLADSGWCSNILLSESKITTQGMCKDRSFSRAI
jgi:hypothetical protein